MDSLQAVCQNNKLKGVRRKLNYLYSFYAKPHLRATSRQ